jgi:DNA-binding transcriptional regulator YiaG
MHTENKAMQAASRVAAQCELTTEGLAVLLEPGDAPTPETIKAARASFGLSQTQAAALVSATLRTWQGWEAGRSMQGARQMSPSQWALFRLRAAAVAYCSPDEGMHTAGATLWACRASGAAGV